MSAYLLQISDERGYFSTRNLGIFLNENIAKQTCFDLNTLYNKVDGFFYRVKTIPLATDGNLKEDYKPDLYLPKEYHVITNENRIVDVLPTTLPTPEFLYPKHDYKMEKRIMTGAEYKQFIKNTKL